MEEHPETGNPLSRGAGMSTLTGQNELTVRSYTDIMLVQGNDWKRPHQQIPLADIRDVSPGYPFNFLLSAI